MSMSDPISDLITRLRNGQLSGLRTVSSPHSSMRISLLEVLKREGYIIGFSIETNKNNNIKTVNVELKYFNSKPVISNIARISKPGCRVYSSISSLGKFFNGLGVYILSTPKGILSDHEAREQNVGGELLVSVY